MASVGTLGREATKKDNLTRAIDRLEKEVVGPAARDISISFALQTGYLIILVLFGIVTNLNPTFFTVVGTLGLGSLGVGANFERLQKAVTQFLSDRRALKSAVTGLRIRLDLCKETDTQCLAEVEELLKKRVSASLGT
jgi:hypothetical protein